MEKTTLAPPLPSDPLLEGETWQGIVLGTDALLLLLLLSLLYMCSLLLLLLLLLRPPIREKNR